MVICFHIIVYGLLKFVFDDIVTLHFIHLYAVLFFIEVAIMLVVGRYHPRNALWTYSNSCRVDLKPWRFAGPCAVTLMSCVIGLYVLFSPIGLVGGISSSFWWAIGALLCVNLVAWLRGYKAVESA